MAQYELNVYDYWLIIRKRKYTILLTIVLVSIFTFALSQLLQPPLVYEASARVKFDRTSTFAGLLLEAVTPSAVNELATQSEVVRSFPVLEQAAKELELVPAEVTDQMRKSEEYLRVIYNLQEHIKTAQEGQTNIIKIVASAGDAPMAARTANAVAHAYWSDNIRTRNRLVIDSKRFVEEQLAAMEARLANAEQALREFKEREGQVILDAEAKAVLDAFTRAESDYNRVRALKEEAARQIEFLKREGAPRERPAERIFTDEPGALLSALNARLLDLYQERDTLLINYTPEHLQVKELDRKIMNIKDEMVRELESKIKTLSDRGANLKAQIDSSQARYMTFPKAAIDLARLERDVKVTSDLVAELKEKHQELLIKSAERIEEVTIIEPAVAPGKAANEPNVQLNMVVGTLMGLFLGIVLAFMRESFDTSLGTIEGVEDFLKIPVLGVIPRFDEKELMEIAAKELPPEVSAETLEVFSKLVSLYDPKSVLAEGFRSLRTNIQFACMDRNIKTLLFTSAALGEGKTTVVINLAATLAQDGKRVLLVDADLRKPIIHARLGFQREPGLTEILVSGQPWRESVRTVTDLMLGVLGVDCVMNTPGLDNLNVLTSGTIGPNPSEFLNSNRFKDIVAEMREEYDFVLFDTPPILPIADAVTVGGRVDGSVLVYQVGRIGRNPLKRAKFLLEHAQAKVIGVVLTNVRAEVTPEYAYYRYEYR